jgi:soluble lytic murein transglycosylase-like protein
MIRKSCLATLLVVLAVPAFAQPRQAHPDANGALAALIARHAAAANVPASLVRRVIRRESRGNPRLIYKGNYGLMQIKLATARAMGYRGGAAGLLDADTNMTYAVKYLAGAYRVARGNADLAVHYYAAGYYYAAKRDGLLNKNAANPIGAFARAAAGKGAATSARASAPAALKQKLDAARGNGMNVASSSNPYTGKLDQF